MKFILYVEWGVLMIYGSWLLTEAAGLPVGWRIAVMGVVAFVFSAIVFGGM